MQSFSRAEDPRGGWGGSGRVNNHQRRCERTRPTHSTHSDGVVGGGVKVEGGGEEGIYLFSAHILVGDFYADG